MIFGREKSLRDDVISTGKKIYDLRLAVARSGNLSGRLDEKNILITATGTCLGALTGEDIIKVDFSNPDEAQKKRLTSEFPLHKLIHENFPAKMVVHCHPTLVNAYFAVCQELKTLTFETQLYVSDVPVVEQETPSVTRPELVIEALENSNLVVIKNHGVVAIAENFRQALYLVETLEEAVKTAAVARIFKKNILDPLDLALKEELGRDQGQLMFSREHIQAIVDLVNKDELIAAKGKELDLTLQLAIKMDGNSNIYKFIFEKGTIKELAFDENAPYVISAPAQVWEAVFLGKINPFVATTQGKMKLKGDFGKLSRWFVPFNRLFEIFRQVKIK